MALSISNITQNKSPLLSAAKFGLKTTANLFFPALSAVDTFAPKKQALASGNSNVLPTSGLSSPGPAYANTAAPRPTPQQQAPSGLVPTAYAAQPTYQPTTAPAVSRQQAPTSSFSFPDIIKGLVQPPAQQQRQNNYLDLIRQSAEQSKAVGDSARAVAEKYGSEIGRVGKLGAGAVAGDLSTGTNIVGSGNAAIASQSASSRMNALSNALGAELQGTNQQLAGQEAQTAGLNNALSGGFTQQQLGQSALQAAGGLAAPNATSYGQTVFNPLTGSFSGGGGNLDPQQAAAQLAQDVIAGRKTYEQAVSSLGYAGGAGQQFLNNALQQVSPGFNAPLSSSQVGGQAGIFSQLPQLQAADTAAEGIKNKITTYLASNPKLNPSDLALSNSLQQWIQGKQLTDPKYQTLFNYLNEYTNTLAPILGVGGDPTNLKTEIAQSFINAAASGQSIATVLDNMQALSRGKILDIQSGALGGGVKSSPTTGTGTGSGSIWDF